MYMSALWPNISENTCILTRNMRGTNPLFADWLLDIGNGILAPSVNILEHNIRVVNTPAALKQATFGSILYDATLPHLIRHVILSPTKKTTQIFNEEVQNLVVSPSI